MCRFRDGFVLLKKYYRLTLSAIAVLPTMAIGFGGMYLMRLTIH